jgi:CRP/FNR family cyclic AMP-dependent transcriptional regulator
VISPELLRRYPFFCCLDEAQQKAIAMIAEDALIEKGVTLFEEGDPANTFYLLMEGGVDLFYPASRELHDLFLVAEINQGEPFSISALIEPHVLTATAKTTSSARILKVNAQALRALCEVDAKMGYALMRQAAMAAMERLHFARVQLAAARS